MTQGSSIKNSEIRANINSRLKDFLNILPVAVYACDIEGYVTDYNEEAAKLWGRRPEKGKDMWCGSWKIYNLDGTQLPLDECPMAQAIKGEKPTAGTEVIIEQPNGTRFHVLPHPYPIYDDNGVLSGGINIVVDVTDQIRFRNLKKQTEEIIGTIQALKKSEERYHRMVSEVTDYAIILLSRDGLIENWNKGAENIKGYSEKEILGKSFRVFYTPEDQRDGLPDKLIQMAVAMGKVSHEGWRVRKGGTRFWGSVSITSLHDSEGHVTGFAKVTRDLTERRLNELKVERLNEDLRKKNELLRQSEERYHRMISEVEDFVIILLSKEGFIQNWNKGAQKIKGYESEEIHGKHFSIFYSAQDQQKGVPETLLAEAAKKGKALHEGWRTRKDGTTFWGSVVITALHNDEGALIGFTKVTRDLTEKKIAEDRLLATSLKLELKNKELERTNEELSSFAYISSHDLQEPLRKIQTFSDRILELEYQNLSEKGRDYFKRMQAGALRMQTLIRDILAYSRTTTSEKKLEMTDLNELLAQSMVELEVMILEKKAIIESDRLPAINVIPFQVQQLFNNLLNNALKFSKPEVQPHVVIRTEFVDGQIFKPAFPVPARQYCHISIKDNGIGFERIYEKKIFEVFQRLHARAEYGGTGIGLSICKKILENHNGMITAEGVPHGGAIFHVYLPVVS
ncbi:MAG: PAS domain S-box protein [Cyclobacteriaceae bacterium]